VVTRNIADFAVFGVPVPNPFDAAGTAAAQDTT
jgi:hypothetical protein